MSAATAALRIATRQSRLALWQAEHVAAKLRAAHRGLVRSAQERSGAHDVGKSSGLMQHGAGRHRSIDVDWTSRDLEASGDPGVRVVEQPVPTSRAIEQADAVRGGRDDDRTAVGIHGVRRIDVARKRGQALGR